MGYLLQLLENVFIALGVARSPDIYDFYALLSIFVLLFLTLTILVQALKTKPEKELPSDQEEPQKKPQKKSAPPVEPKVSWKERLAKGLKKSREDVWKRVEGLFTTGLDESVIEE